MNATDPTTNGVTQQQRVNDDYMDSSRPWRGGTITAIVCFSISTFLLVLALTTKTVLEAEYNHVFTTTISYRVDYYGANIKTSVGGEEIQKSDYDLDDATCENASLVQFSGAVHYFAFFLSISALVSLALELRTQKPMKHASVCFISLSIGLLFVLQVCLGSVRAKANATNCTTVPAGLVRYGIGPCWGLAIAAMIVGFLGFVVYISARYCMCCCYRSPAQLAASDLVAGQVVAVQHPETVFPQPQQSPEPISDTTKGMPDVYGQNSHPEQHHPIGYGPQTTTPSPQLHHHSDAGSTVELREAEYQ